MSTLMSTANPTVFPDAKKFDGTNWYLWKQVILTTTKIKGINGYLLGQIPQPSPSPPTAPTATTTALSPKLTSWNSLSPLPSKWKMRNVWTKGLILYNCINPVGLELNLARTAAGAWAALISLYDIQSDIAAVNAQCDLCNMIFKDVDVDEVLEGHGSKGIYIGTKENGVPQRKEPSIHCKIPREASTHQHLAPLFWTHWSDSH